jgi:hypothetical protein
VRARRRRRSLDWREAAAAIEEADAEHSWWDSPHDG